MQFTINNQTVTIGNNRTDVTIHHAAEDGGDKSFNFPFSLLDYEAIVALKSKDFAMYWWLGTLAMQIRQLSTSASQLELFN